MKKKVWDLVNHNNYYRLAVKTSQDNNYSVSILILDPLSIMIMIYLTWHKESISIRLLKNLTACAGSPSDQLMHLTIESTHKLIEHDQIILLLLGLIYYYNYWDRIRISMMIITCSNHSDLLIKRARNYQSNTGLWC